MAVFLRAGVCGKKTGRRIMMSREVSVKTVAGRGAQGSIEGRYSEGKKTFFYPFYLLC